MWGRRQFLATSAAALTLFLGRRHGRTVGPPRFSPVPVSRDDRLVVPDGYEARVVLAWGDALGLPGALPLDRSAPTAERQAFAAGTGHDGVELFPVAGRSRDRWLVALNHEFAEVDQLLGTRRTAWDEDAAALVLAAHGVSIFEISDRDGHWRVVPSRRARRITGDTPMTVTGPAAGSRHLVTAADPLGRNVLGTLSNCATGQTPWGTLLTCEENFDDYFFAPTLDARGKRYGLRDRDIYPLHQAIPRFDTRVEPNEPHRFGWVVEVDPSDPKSTPKKRTALGRFKHETATVRRDDDGTLAIYMGDDEAFEHLYKFVPSRRHDPRRMDPDLLDEGTLYAAILHPDGTGTWAPLVHRSLDPKSPLDATAGFADQAEVLVFARLAATLLGATPLDRPEWVALDPLTHSAYVALTNNRGRGAEGLPPTDAANPRGPNTLGHILKWRDDRARDLTFTWEVAAFGRGGDDPNGFACPDALRFDAEGRLWIGTDAPQRTRDAQGLGNDALLCLEPANGEVRRFLTAPVGAEVTGIAPTPDGRSLFVCLQHPSGTWPDGAGLPPRSALVAITRKDGGPVA